jgi:hypothetical protein
MAENERKSYPRISAPYQQLAEPACDRMLQDEQPGPLVSEESLEQQPSPFGLVGPHVAAHVTQDGERWSQSPQCTDSRSQDIEIRPLLARISPATSRPAPDSFPLNIQSTPHCSLVLNQNPFEDRLHTEGKDHSWLERRRLPAISGSRSLGKLLESLPSLHAPDYWQTVGVSEEPVEIQSLNPAAEIPFGIPGGNEIPGHHRHVEGFSC